MKNTAGIVILAGLLISISTRGYSQAGVECNSFGFWAISAGGIDEFTLLDTVVQKTGTTAVTTGFDLSLAYCSNLSGGAYTPCFYSTVDRNQVAWANATSTVPTGVATSNGLSGCGGYANYLYYLMYDNLFNSVISVVRFDGQSLIPIYFFPTGRTATVADLAVDLYGNAWVFCGRNDGLFNTDTIKVFSPEGQVLKQYPFSRNTLNAYGCFLLNSLMYIGLGPVNPLNPNTLLPVNINADTAIAGIPFSMRSTVSYSDLASCSPGSPIGINEIKSPDRVHIYPNPVFDRLTINSPFSGINEFTILDLTSKPLIQVTFTSSVTVNTANLQPGYYLYFISDKSGRKCAGKVLKNQEL